MANYPIDSQYFALAPTDLLRDWLGETMNNSYIKCMFSQKTFFHKNSIIISRNIIAQYLVPLPGSLGCEQWSNLRFILKTVRLTKHPNSTWGIVTNYLGMTQFFVWRVIITSYILVMLFLFVKNHVNHM